MIPLLYVKSLVGRPNYYMVNEGNVYQAPTGELILVVHVMEIECMCTILPATEPYPQFPAPAEMLKEFKYLGNIKTHKKLRLLFLK